MSDDLDTLTTLTLTRQERILLARVLTIFAAGVDEMGEGETARKVLAVWERVQPDGTEF